MEILFGAGLRQAQTDNRKKIETIAGLPEPKNYENCFTPILIKISLDSTLH